LEIPQKKSSTLDNEKSWLMNYREGFTTINNQGDADLGNIQKYCSNAQGDVNATQFRDFSDHAVLH
jgi:hypothetical protein